MDTLHEAMDRAIRELERQPELTIQVFHHNDSDGLSSRAILIRALEQQGLVVIKMVEHGEQKSPGAAGEATWLP